MDHTAFIQRPRRWASVLLDRALGMETWKPEEYEDLEFGPDQGVKYEPTPWSNLLQVHRILSDMSISERDVFVDLGSGKGRVILTAAQFPFKRIVGVEISQRLHEISRLNVSRRPQGTCREIELVNLNAIDYRLPHDASVLYMYNPFKGDVFEGVLGHIRKSIETEPRPVTIIYTNPVMHHSLISSGFALSRRLGSTNVYVCGSPSAHEA